MIGFEDFILVFYIRVPNTTIEDVMEKNSNLNNILLLLLNILPKQLWF
jgi:hypothetical protein